MNTDLLTRRVTASLPSLIGEKLLAVYYWCVRHEASSEGILDAGFYCGGEVELRFTSVGSIFVTWDENAGWRDHFSVKVTGESAFVPESLEPFDASSAPQWKDHVGCTLLACTVLGWDDVPHIVSFGFPKGEVFIGDGYGRHGFGDGDDVLVRTGNDVACLPFMIHVATLWREPKRP